jgi:hypothetical protein
MSESLPRRRASGTTRGREELLTRAILASSLLVLVANGVLLFDTFHGDPAIYLVYARNAAHGSFFSFNPGEFSSGSTSPLWGVLLSAAFLLPASIGAAKGMALAATILACWVTYRTAASFSGSRFAAALAGGLILWALVPNGLMLYESPLIVALISILIQASAGLLEGDAGQARRRLLVLAICWTAIPLSRPDASLVVVLDAFILALAMGRARGLHLFAILGVSSIPSLAYYGYSRLTLGMFSVSSVCRAFALQETARTLAGHRYSLAALRECLHPPLIVGVGCMVWVWARADRGSALKTTSLLALLVTGAYLALFTFVAPVTVGAERYLIPVVPFLVATSSVSIREAGAIARRSLRIPIVLLFAALLLVQPCFERTKASLLERGRGYDFDTIVEAGVVGHINEIAEPHAVVLVYEAQDRFYLRPDLRLLSLDGITDGRVREYFTGSDLTAFLRRYRPSLWLANDAVFYRPYLGGSVLRRALEAIAGREGAVTTMNGITFENLRVRTEPVVDGFAGYRDLIRLSYADTGTGPPTGEEASR